MAKMNELNQGIALDIEKSFGRLKFLRMKEDKRKEDEEGELVSTQSRYVVQSERQLSEEVISIDISVEKKAFHFGDTVQLINPRIEYYSFRQGRRTDNYLKIVADDIVKVNHSKLEETKKKVSVENKA
ncbi:hypothetical protein BH747_02105 [Enterococcus villorum]|uniref:DUF961 domain-containing protein n=1 Tax=Enterococcus villorum TaxID=112904 RepID=A0A1V8YG99_9ENTE|nr:DUF961 family protein [Enterococcus villorum]OQO71645.1 hypothetical protein BH747_02105 [Enterococcus villorum]